MSEVNYNLPWSDVGGVKHPTYGNYGGAGYSAGEMGGDATDINAPKPVNALDAFYRQHDLDYSHTDPQKAYEANKKFLEGLNKAIEDPNSKLNEEFGDQTMGLRDAEYLYASKWIFERDVKQYEGDNNLPEEDRYIPPNKVSPPTDKFPMPSPNEGGDWPLGSSGGSGMAKGLSDGLANAASLISPLVLDLDGDGVELSSVEGSTAFFDLDRDGFAEQTGWVSADDGLLALDINGNGYIDDISELFGNATTDGFTELAALDSNGDGIIDASDTEFANLKIWQDMDQDGLTDDGELSTLMDQGIVSIDLGATITDSWNAGNHISHESTFTRSDGSTNAVEDIWFANDQMHTRYTGGYTLDLNTLYLPWLRGYGEVKDLHIAMSEDETLLNMVQALAFSDYAGQDYTADVEAIILRWTGADDYTGFHGNSIDARKFEAVHQFIGEQGVELHGNIQGSAFREIWADFVKGVEARLMLQGPMSDLFVGVAYDWRTDRFVSDSDLTSVVTGSIAQVQVGSASHYRQLVNVLDQVALEQGIDITAYDAILETALVDAEISLSLSELRDKSSVLGTAGDDRLEGAGFTDIIYGGHGNDTLIGNAGADTYVFSSGDGHDVIQEYSISGHDRLIFTDVNMDDVTFSQNTGKDLIITLSNGETVTIVDHFLNYNYDVSYIEFADGTVLGLQGIRDKSVADQKISGMIRGSLFVENYRHSLGDGSYSIIEYSISGHDRLIFTDVNMDEVTFSQNSGKDLIITLSNGETVTIVDHFLNYNYDVSYIEFADGTVLGLQGIRDKSVADQKISGMIRGSLFVENYRHSLGDGSYSIIEYSISGHDRLIFTDVNMDDVTFSQNTGKDLIITLSNGEAVTIIDHFLNYNYDVSYIEFADGTVLGSQGIKNKLLFGSNDSDTLVGFNSSDILNGNSGDDYLEGGKGNDTLIGGEGNDTLSGGFGTDSFDGEGGIDTADYSYSSENWNIDLATGTAGAETLTSIENIIAGSGNDMILGNAENNILDGGVGSDTLFGGGGNDILIGNFGFDSFDGGSGVDTADFSYSSENWNINLVFGLATVAGGAENLVSIENIIAGSGNDIIVGNAVNSIFKGGDGADIYQFARGGGQDVIDDYATDGATDTLVLDIGIDHDELWFEQTGDDLLISVIGTSDQITVENWYASADNKIENIETGDGKVADFSSVEALVSAMASFSPPGGAATDLSDPIYDPLDSVLAGTWQASL
ncbi:M10 family metallopeptidase C-terminal domain-containing protein [Sneathiella marina]|uniref:M10 family metallopeptidase C-terminal domain-containing protein n=1 Tax=Sneathiella marina TaxID=2950108 RepID=A0ABY4W0Y7_9PROT|nr:calcium-binding protein [Sneathiella marina]USG59738.1 M10 family metallopeptidase C-terminal domain-containing protein [Sneathiella marina]